MKEFVIPNEIKTVLDRLYESGFSAYIVGGCVRDILMGIEPHDYDVTTSSTPEQTLAVFADHQTYELGRKFGTIIVVSGEHHVEITTMRTEKGYADGRRPDEVIFTDSILEDASRRDFTINAMAYSLQDGFFDGFGGTDDIENKLIRAVGNAETRFTEDGLRIMRALRFAARFGFEIEENTANALESCAFMLDNIAKERIREELDRLLMCKTVPGIIDRYYGIFCRIIPQLANIDKAKMLAVLKNTGDNRILRLCALLAQTNDAESILKSLKYSNEDIEKVTAIVNSQGADISTDAQIRRLMNKIGAERTADYIEFVDGTTQAKNRLEAIIERGDPYRLKDLAVNGGDLIKMGVKGENIGRILGILLKKVIENPSENTREKLIINIKSHLE